MMMKRVFAMFPMFRDDRRADWIVGMTYLCTGTSYYDTRIRTPILGEKSGPETFNLEPTIRTQYFGYILRYTTYLKIYVASKYSVRHPLDDIGTSLFVFFDDNSTQLAVGTDRNLWRKKAFFVSPSPSLAVSKQACI